MTRMRAAPQPRQGLKTGARTAAVRRAVAVAALAVAAVGLPAVPAAAHSELLTSLPAAGESLATPPQTVMLTFNQQVAPRFAVVAVTTADGVEWTAGEPVVAGTTLSQSLRPGAAGGDYTVSYRVVSADGHPISGNLAFRVLSGAEQPTAAVRGPGTTVSPPVVTARGEGAVVTDPMDDGVALLPLAGAGAVVLLIAVSGVVRSRRAAAVSTSPGRRQLWPGRGRR